MEAESEVVLLSSFVFASMLRMLMTQRCDSAVAGVASYWVFFLYIVRPVSTVCFSRVFAWKPRWKFGTLLNESEL